MLSATKMTGTSSSPTPGAASDLVAWLRTPEAVRARATALCGRATAGESDAFRVHRDRLADVTKEVRAVIDETPPGRPHGRMRHFDAGGVPRSLELDARLREVDADERARAKIDLVVTSVLLDAGAGDTWTFFDGGVRLSRSEGLAVASLRLFVSGALSGAGARPRCDADGLRRVTSRSLGEAFQVSADNQLVGVDGRAHLLRALGDACRARPDVFGEEARPGHLLDWARARSSRATIPARELLGAVLECLSPIWPGRVELAGQNLGDVWPHPALGRGPDALVPFHKLSQWLTYSLVEPFAEAGLRVTELEALTVLPEYRSGGLLLDTGALELVDPAAAGRLHTPAEPLIVEWRALTVALYDEIVPSLREAAASKTTCAPGLVELAIWTAGRRLAHRRCPNGTPPLAVESDGTVF